MTVMIFQLEGNDQTLQEGFRTIGTALDNILAKGTKILGAPNNNHPHAEPLPEKSTESADEQDDEQSIDLEAEASPRASGSRRSKSRNPQIISLNLSSGQEPLKAFMLAHDPDGTNKRYLLLAHWLKVNLGVAEVSMDHMHTCFRHLGWPTPSDPSQPLRDMKGVRYGWFDKGSRGHYALTHVGENKALEIIKGEDK